MEKKVWRGIQNNFCLFQGEITADPQFNGDYAFLNLRTIIIQRDANGQIVEVDQDIPLMVEPGGPLRVVRDYIKQGRKLQAWCHYKSWESDQGTHHMFVARKFDLGDKPYEGSPAENTPPLPE
jgi:hypothetical protein